MQSHSQQQQATALTIRAVLFSALAIFGHLLVSTSLHPAVRSNSTTAIRSTVESLSALTFLTILWLAFTCLELADPTLGQPGSPGSARFFSHLNVELILAPTLLAGWILNLRPTLSVLHLYSPLFDDSLIFMKGSFCAIVALLLLLSAHLVYTTLFPTSAPSKHRLSKGVVPEAKEAIEAIEAEFELTN